jgi:hypothetical protein
MSDEVERPDYLYIGSIRWTIEWDAKLKAGTLGLCEQAAFTIRISKTPDSEDVRRSTLLHEIMHAIWFTYGFRPSIKDPDDHEEQVVAFLSSGVYDTMVNNLHVAYYIFEQGASEFYVEEESEEEEKPS